MTILCYARVEYKRVAVRADVSYPAQELYVSKRQRLRLDFIYLQPGRAKPNSTRVHETNKNLHTRIHSEKTREKPAHHFHLPDLSSHVVHNATHNSLRPCF